MPAAIDAPPAPPPGVRIVQPSTPPKPPPAPTREIHPVVGRDPHPTAEPPKPGTAKERLFKAIEKKAGIQDTETPPTPRPETPPTTPPETPDPNEAPEAAQASTETPPATPPAAQAPKPKVNPWKLVDEWKGKYAELEKKHAEVTKTGLPETEKKQYLTQIEQLQQSNQRLEKEMAYVNYQETTEFKKQYDEPYEKAWTSFQEELGELHITDPNTQERRPVTTKDMMALLSLDLEKAQATAENLYGPFATEMMAHRREIRNLMIKRNSALKDARENAGKELKLKAELSQKQTQELRDNIRTGWEAVNQNIVKDPVGAKYFLPIEGDQDGNQRLGKGYQLVDRAFTENPDDPSLTADQRRAVLERHAMVRHRAAAFGRQRLWLEQALAENESLKQELAKFKGSTPPTGGAPAPAAGEAGANGSAWSRVQSALRAKAR